MDALAFVTPQAARSRGRAVQAVAAAATVGALAVLGAAIAGALAVLLMALAGVFWIATRVLGLDVRLDPAKFAEAAANAAR